MDERLSEQIRLVLEDATERARKLATERLQAVYADRNRRGLLHTSITVSGAIESLEEDASRYISDCVDRIAAVDKSIEAFAMLAESTGRFLGFLTAKFDEAMKKGLDGRGQQTRAPNFENQFTKLWPEACTRSTRQLEIHRFTLTTPSPAFETPSKAGTVRLKKNEGGKPLAQHWDAMWAEIAVRL